MLRHIKAQAIVILAIYLVGAFIAFDFSWVASAEPAARGLAFIVWVFIGIAAASITEDAR